ncbi:hypothetical protein MCEPAE42_01136 [Candidatus Nanopelagicaceae bacterium]
MAPFTSSHPLPEAAEPTFLALDLKPWDRPLGRSLRNLIVIAKGAM